MFPNANDSQAWSDYPELRSTSLSTFAIGEELLYRSTHGLSVEKTSKHLWPASVAIVDSELGPFGGHCMWPVITPLQTTPT